MSQPWLTEAVGNAEWTGTSLAPILEEAGLEEDAVDVVFTGLDRGVQGGVDQLYERSLSLADATRPEVLLAYAINGQPLPPQHGFPLRLIVPGWYGMTHVKWLRSITAVDAGFGGYQQATAYHYRANTEIAGEPVTRMLPRALMVPPGVPDFMTRTRFVEPSRVQVEGRAWSCRAPGVRVEFSADGGAIAAAEASNRQRIEKRLRELGETVPDPSTVSLSVIQRLQARLAPVETVIAHMEAAEELEITDRYKRPTGDADTDAVLEEIRVEEQGHSRSLESMEVAHRAAPAPSSVQSRLNRILGRESWHRTGAGWISGAIYGANDGLAAVFGIVAGVSGATGGSSFVLTAGLFGAIASGLSIATGAYLAERSEGEVAAANVQRERQEITEHPEEEKEEVSLFFQLKGIDKEMADRLAEP